MKIIIHTMYYLPEFGSAPILMSELASYLASRGHQVEVVTTIPRQRGKKYHGRLYVKELNNGFLLKRFWTNATAHPLGRLIAWNIYTMWSIFNILTMHKGDVVFLRSPPLQLGITGMCAKKLKGAKVLLNVQDIHPDLAIESGVLRNPLAVKLAKKFEKWVYDHSGDIVVISDGFKQNLVDKRVSPEKIQVIPNWVDADFLKPLPKENPVAKKLFLHNKFVLLYSGTITMSSYLSLERMLEVAHYLKNDSDSMFAIVGEGLKKQRLQEKADEAGLHNVAFIPFQPYDDLPYLLAASDVLLVPLDREKSQLSVPSKLYHYMAMGRPILGLADSGSEIATIIAEADCGVCVAPDNVKNIAEVIRELKNSKDYRDTLAANGRKYAVEHFSKELILKEYEDVMQAL